MMWMLRTLGVVAFFALSAAGAWAQEYQIVDVPALAAGAAGKLAPHTIVFADHRQDELADPSTGLIPFESWARAHPIAKEFLGLYPSYVEPTVGSNVNGVTKPTKEKLHMYVAEARFLLLRPPQAILLAPSATSTFLERIDPAISHRLVSAAEVDNRSNPNPDRRWCDGKPDLLCLESRYQLEGKLPAAIHLLNKLVENKKKIADYLEFQSELRILHPPDIDEKKLAALTGIGAPLGGGFEQAIFHMNQIIQFGKFLCVFQQDPTASTRTIATAFIVLAIKTRVLEKQKKYEKVPVLRNLIPAQVLVGNSSFNSGNSMSAGLPRYARNQIKAVAALLEHE